jgi:hypothetical protein
VLWKVNLRPEPMGDDRCPLDRSTNLRAMDASCQARSLSVADLDRLIAEHTYRRRHFAVLCNRDR